MERRTRRRVVRKSRKIRENTFFLLTMAMMLCLGTFALGAQTGTSAETYYEAVQIEKGDSLWKIAEEYKAAGQKTEHMMREILEINGIEITNIQAGESIIVPMRTDA